MVLDPAIRLEWSSTRGLSASSLRWIEDHADAGDPHAITSAIDALRREDAGPARSDALPTTVDDLAR